MAKKVKYTSEEDVLKKLKEKSFDNLPENKYNKLMTILPMTSPEVVIKIIDQLPDAIKTYGDVLHSIVEASKEGTKRFQDACQTVLDAFNEMAKDKELSQEERREIRDKILWVLGLMHENEKLNTDKWLEFAKLAGKGVLVVGGIAIAILTGGKYKPHG